MGRIFVENDAFDFFLVGRIDHRVDERHDERLAALIDELAHLLADVLVLDRHAHRTLVVDALLDTDDHRDRHQGDWPVGTRQIGLAGLVEAIAVAARAHQRDRGFITRRSHQADARTVALDQRTGAERSGIAHRVDRAQHITHGEIQLSASITERFHEARRQIVMGGERLRFDVIAVVGEKAIGKRTADINTNPPHRSSPPAVHDVA